ncbi:hypothetical protein M569_15469 [Genlisea aurea]|uniref:S-protein homolog n=1 Tax=Genlisea aurea TaxID=192259 RepID=S8BXR2_9LAMI|nr:hypothetical protein M569_15469 [Genlisea aurea]
MESKTLPVLLTAFLVLAWSCSAARKCTEIHVVNDLDLNDVLDVACSSKDDDLGGKHAIGSAKDFRWRFCEKDVVYDCILTWGPVSTLFHAFDAGDDATPRCGRVCSWVAKPDGIYFSDTFPPKSLNLTHSW